ncbi:hypothetical protein SAY87_006958 [Trapa incisa]|uniref:Xylanase inhibitor N-terminal domain-containing protein n=1 Tax=Trapa incisa TaxID=236973 RepID=A0AAN7K034_9MYRT|nr:hypothetical protein SAY87_006958 [Trapa incisa]
MECSDMNSGLFIGAAGLLGLGDRSLSFVGQLGGQTGGFFSYCLVSRGTGSSGSLKFGHGAMLLGPLGSPPSGIPGPRAFFIGLMGKAGDQDIFHLTKLGDGVMMDTGAAVSWFLNLAYDDFHYP